MGADGVDDQVEDWWEYNSGLRVIAPSRYPPPTGWKDRVTERDDMGRFRGTAPRTAKPKATTPRRAGPKTEMERLREIAGPPEEALEYGAEADMWDDVEEDDLLFKRHPEVEDIWKLRERLEMWDDVLYDVLKGDYPLPEDKARLLYKLLAECEEEEE